MPRRYIINQTVMVRSTAPDTVFQASQNIRELVDESVVTTADYLLR